MKSEIDHLGAQIKLVTLPHGLDPEDDRSDQPKVILSLKSTMPTKLHELILDINNNNALDADNNNKITCLVVSKNIGWALEVAHKLGIKGALLWPASATSLASFESIRLIDEGIIDSQTGVCGGIPFLCWPFFSDQFINKSYVCDVWKVGLGLNKDENGLILKGVLCRIMARIPDKIKDINGSKETLKLAVRITDLWFVGTPDKIEQAEMVIVDSDGDEIHVVCKQDQLKSWKMDLKENCTYVMHNFKVIKNDGQYREIVCVTIGTITRIVMENHSWCYPACIQCHKKTDINTAPFTCACGKYNERAVLRYRLEVMVNHKEESTKFLLWDHECTNLIGQSADEVNRLKIADGDIDLNALPEVLDKLLGYVLAFKVKVQPKFRNVVFLKYSSDLSLINTVMDLLPDAEASSKIHIPILDSNDPPQHEFQSLSGTADHDPLLGLPLTADISGM
ncbi:hypothetical protein JHK86_022336 [Glycine max]|nr:hypothetical protein JHK86_022336 [Glycine max]